MRSALALVFGRFDRPIDRATYVRAGLSLMLLKYVVDAALIGWFGGVFWTPVDYLLPMITFNAAKVAGFPTALNVALLLWTVPFLCMGVSFERAPGDRRANLSRRGRAVLRAAPQLLPDGGARAGATPHARGGIVDP
jgi:hypothetical protein